MPRLIVLEGADGTGKTTQAKRLADVFQARLLHQPSGTNLVGFIRSIVKDTESPFSLFERQLMHSISHIVDAYEEFNEFDNVVMDRSPISAWVYGNLLGLSGPELDIIMKANFSVYRRVVAKYKYDVAIIHLSPKVRYKSADADYYEGQTNHSYVKDWYKEAFSIGYGPMPYFSSMERIYTLGVGPEDSEDVVFDKIRGML